MSAKLTASEVPVNGSLPPLRGEGQGGGQVRMANDVIAAPAPSTPEPPRRSRPVVVLAALALTAGLGWWWTVREYGSPAGLRQRLGGAQVIVANPQIDLGVAKIDEWQEFAFRVRNCSSSTVRLLGMRSACSCLTTGALPVDVPPGAWHELTGKIKATAASRQARPLELYTDHPSADLVPCSVVIVGQPKSG